MRFDSNLYGTKIFVYSWSDESQSWAKIKTFKLNSKDEDDDLDFFPVAPTNSPDQLYVLSDEEEYERRAIKIYDLKEQKYVETVFEHEIYDVSDAFLDIATGEYAGAWYYADRLQFQFINNKSQAHYKALNQFFDNEANVDVLGFNNSGSKAVIYVSAPDIPGEYYIYDLSTVNIEPIMIRKPDLSATKFGKAEIINIPMRDGETITAYLTHPSSGKIVLHRCSLCLTGGPKPETISITMLRFSSSPLEDIESCKSTFAALQVMGKLSQKGSWRMGRRDAK